jgi:hypothetical protein
MPYINQTDRECFDKVLSKLPAMRNKGELEYCIFTLLVKYKDMRTFKYSELHDACYAAMHCADEFRRRFLDEREDEARLQNGDINGV